ncbi:MAG: preprotein translocase subunit SecA [Rhodospirillaceae bacterium]|nr:preprotein translocase subunit SecA [Rhodospirillaceae bacterium]MBT6240740.1 preprotein translocase subunit SecA [Rhodospirillaceae bacterium]MBT7137746.1 preprotein translocase subunit SecA [Rhodospirillaceae bacterium]
MIGAIARRLFGSANERFLKTLNKDVEAINALEAQLEALSDDELRARTPWLKDRLSAGESLDDLLVDAFATVREAAKRTLGQRHFDVQLLGGVVLHRGMITEMRTGEGKTLASTLPVYLNALSGEGAHVVTVNDYLAKRDSEWMSAIYNALGMSCSSIVHGLDDDDRRAAYASDVTYATNNELGFDYLRDNMKFTLEDMVQRPFGFAIVDEVDSILIDEARTPLIISGPTEDAADMYVAIDKLIPKLSPEDYEKDEKVKAVTMTEVGTENVEQLLRKAGLLEEGSMYDMNNITLVHHANQALRAHILFERDTDYIVSDNKVVIIDEFTGRMMEGRRYSDGLHQALEAKEGVEIQNENQTLASITFQNYFRLYPKLAGMTGTAMTEAGEFSEIYGLEVIDIPTNVACIRDDMDDEVYRTTAEKDAALITLIKECQKRHQPTLVGTVSIEKSEHLSDLLKADKIEHNVLNARHHEQEANIIATAGEPGSVTIATNMAGRGTDIQLGGNLDMLLAAELDGVTDEAKIADVTARITDEIKTRKQQVLEAGGLYIVGTERHESRRIDNQLRGRAGRQGDVGASKFFLSLEDDLMRIFGSERIDTMLQKLGLEEGEAIVHPWVNKALEKAQQKVEARNFEIRKNLLKFDDVMNDQRKVIFEQRKELMESDDVSEEINDMRAQIIDDMVSRCIPEKAYAEQWDTDGLHEEVLRIFGKDLPIADWAKEDGIADAEIRDRLNDMGNRLAAEKTVNYGAEVIRSIEKNLLLQMLDQVWKDHLLTLDHLRQGIGLRAYAQRDPLNEYKRESFNLFEEMLNSLRERLTQLLAHIELQLSPDEEPRLFQRSEQEMTETREDSAFQRSGDAQGEETETLATPIRSRQASAQQDPNDPSTWGKVARNAPCPCASGKKYKHCHGQV